MMLRVQFWCILFLFLKYLIHSRIKGEQPVRVKLEPGRLPEEMETPKSKRIKVEPTRDSLLDNCTRRTHRIEDTDLTVEVIGQTCKILKQGHHTPWQSKGFKNLKKKESYWRFQCHHPDCKVSPFEFKWLMDYSSTWRCTGAKHRLLQKLRSSGKTIRRRTGKCWCINTRKLLDVRLRRYGILMSTTL